MLVLSRKRGEEFVVPACQLVFRVLEIRGGKVRIGISAPTGSKVFRGEVWTRMQHESADDSEQLVESCTLAANAEAAG